MRPECPYCGSDHIAYLGIEDGGGDYGNALTDEYRCENCDMAFSMSINMYIVSDSEDESEADTDPDN